MKNLKHIQWIFSGIGVMILTPIYNLLGFKKIAEDKFGVIGISLIIVVILLPILYSILDHKRMIIDGKKFILILITFLTISSIIMLCVYKINNKPPIAFMGSGEKFNDDIVNSLESYLTECHEYKDYENNNKFFKAIKDLYLQAIEDYNNEDYEKAEISFSAISEILKFDPLSFILAKNAKILQNKKPIDRVVAFVGPLTGEPKKVEKGVKALMGIYQAQKSSDKRILVYIADDKDDKVKAKSVAEEVVKIPDLCAVIGHMSTATTKEGFKIYTDKKVTSITPTSSGNGLILENSSYRYRMCATDETQANSINTFIKEKGKPKLFFYDKNNESDEDSYVNGLKSKITTPKENKRKLEPDMAFINNIKDIEKETDSIIIISNDSKVSRDFIIKFKIYMAENRKKYNKNLQILCSDSMYKYEFINGGKGDENIYLEKTVVSSFYDKDATNIKSDFLKGFKSTFSGGEPNPRAALSYDCLCAISEATRSVSFLEFRSFDGATGNGITFTSKGERKNADVFFYEVIHGNDGNKFKQLKQ